MIGSRQLTAEFENGNPYELNNCDSEETAIFRAAGVFEILNYDLVEDNENEYVLDFSSEGEWSSPSDGKLTAIEHDLKSYKSTILARVIH